MHQNPYAPPQSKDANTSFSKLGPVLFSATAAVTLMLLMWVLIVAAFDRLVPASYEGTFWAASLWFSTILSTIVVVCCRPNAKPKLACTTGFGLFAIALLVLEGSSTGTSFAVPNLICLPLGVFAVAAVVLRFRKTS